MVKKVGFSKMSLEEKQKCVCFETTKHHTIWVLGYFGVFCVHRDTHTTLQKIKQLIENSSFKKKQFFPRVCADLVRPIWLFFRIVEMFIL